jgi:hypothetical protein
MADLGELLIMFARLIAAIPATYHRAEILPMGLSDILMAGTLN